MGSVERLIAEQRLGAMESLAHYLATETRHVGLHLLLRR